MSKPEITYIKIEDLKMYANNPRKNDEAVEYVKESIKQFGFKVPVVIDKNYEIICGHTRVKSAKQLGITEVPCIIADDLTDEQVKAFRLVDNKVSEFATWDFDLLNEEINQILSTNMEDLGFFEIPIDDLFLEQPKTKPKHICNECGNEF